MGKKWSYTSVFFPNWLFCLDSDLYNLAIINLTGLNIFMLFWRCKLMQTFARCSTLAFLSSNRPTTSVRPWKHASVNAVFRFVSICKEKAKKLTHIDSSKFFGKRWRKVVLFFTRFPYVLTYLFPNSEYF